MASLNNAHMVGKHLEIGKEHFSAIVDVIVAMFPH
jgi:hypothetical protein